MPMKIIILVFIVAVLVVGGYFLFNNKGKVSLEPSPLVTATPTAEPSQTPQPSTKMIKAVIVTAKGSINLELYPEVAPKTVDNFVKLTKAGFYDGTKFHRVIADFMIQGGDPLSKTDDLRVGSGGPGYAFEDEINPRSLGVPENAIKVYESQGYKYNYSLKSLPVVAGAIAMANAGPNTNGSQFFIVSTKPQLHLYGKHTVFGMVTSGMDVVLKIVQGDVIKQIKIVQ